MAIANTIRKKKMIILNLGLAFRLIIYLFLITNLLKFFYNILLKIIL